MHGVNVGPFSSNIYTKAWVWLFVCFDKYLLDGASKWLSIHGQTGWVDGWGRVGVLWVLHNKKCSDPTGWPAAVSAASQAVPVRAALCAPAAAVFVVGHCGSEKSRACTVMPELIKGLPWMFWAQRSASKRSTKSKCDGCKSRQAEVASWIRPNKLDANTWYWVEDTFTGEAEGGSRQQIYPCVTFTAYLKKKTFEENFDVEADVCEQKKKRKKWIPDVLSLSKDWTWVRCWLLLSTLWPYKV